MGQTTQLLPLESQRVLFSGTDAAPTAGECPPLTAAGWRTSGAGSRGRGPRRPAGSVSLRLGSTEPAWEKAGAHSLFYLTFFNVRTLESQGGNRSHLFLSPRAQFKRTGGEGREGGQQEARSRGQPATHRGQGPTWGGTRAVAVSPRNPHVPRPTPPQAYEAGACCLRTRRYGPERGGWTAALPGLQLPMYKVTGAPWSCGTWQLHCRQGLRVPTSYCHEASTWPTHPTTGMDRHGHPERY